MAAYDAKMKALKAKGVAAGNYAAKARAEGAKARMESAVNDKAEKKFAAGALLAKAVKDKAIAKQDKVCKVIGFVPVVGLTMRLYNSGEMKASMAGLGNESYYGVKHVFFKLPASLPEHAATDFLYQFSGSDWRELDPVTVFLVDGRPYWADAMVTGTKIFFGLAGGGVIHAGSHIAYHAHHAHHLHHAHHAILPVLGHAGRATVGQAFLWMAAGGGGLNVVSGAGYQGFMGFKPIASTTRTSRSGRVNPPPWAHCCKRLILGHQRARQEFGGILGEPSFYFRKSKKFAKVELCQSKLHLLVRIPGRWFRRSLFRRRKVKIAKKNFKGRFFGAVRR
jgi:hypothetical protein